MRGVESFINEADAQQLDGDGKAHRRGGAFQSKKFVFIILSFVLALVFEQAFALPEAMGAGTDCPDGISAYWHLDETSSGSYADAIGTNVGTCDGSACPASDTDAVVDRGQSFDGNDMISMGVDPSVFNWAANQGFTIELWVRRSTGTINGVETFIGRTDAATDLNWYLGINSSGNVQVELHAADGSGPAALTVSKDLRSADGTWHHVALVRNASANRTTLYVDGERSAQQTFTYTSDFASDAAPVTLGGDFAGALDEVAIYNRALTEDEIMVHYYVSRGYCSHYDSAVKIMPMGDSITSGVENGAADPQTPLSDVRTGYRYDLWELLGNNLYLFEYNGSQTEGGNNFDNRHAGFTGIRDDQLNTLLRTGTNPQNSEVLAGGPYLNTFPTEIVLLHIGTNGLDTNTGDVDDILDEIDAFSQNVTVMLARIIDQVPNTSTTTAFNNAIEARVAERIDAGDKIIMVNMESGAGFVYQTTSGDMYDQFHPNASGYSKMAGKWFETLETILPQSEVPVITSAAIETAAKGELYTYTVAATGPPRPALELTTNPEPGEMTIDPDSGLIQWTPDTGGDYNVTVRASNWAGEDTQTFTISVNGRPQAMSDAYNDVLEGGTLTVAAADGVLINDTDDENDPLTVVPDSDVSYGTLTLNPDGSFTYIHDDSENFNDSFSYKASDGKAESDAVVVTLTITPVDDPITPDDNGGGGGGGGCFISTLN